MKNNETQLLMFIHDRLVHVYGENPGSDFMLRFLSLIENNRCVQEGIPGEDSKCPQEDDSWAWKILEAEKQEADRRRVEAIKKYHPTFGCPGNPGIDPAAWFKNKGRKNV
jgi:hypothetical protein